MPNLSSSADLFRTHGRRIARLLLRLGAREQDVDDLLQEVFFVVARRGSFDNEGPATPSTWLSSIAVRVMANYRRAQARARSRDGGGLSEHCDDRLTPTTYVFAEERRRLLFEALDSLAPEQREAIVLFDLEGFDGKEAAKIAGISHTAFRSRLIRARSALRERLANPYDDSDAKDGRCHERSA